MHRIFKWETDGDLAERLSELSLVRKRITNQYGGLSEEVKTYLTETKRPQVYQDLIDVMVNSIRYVLGTKTQALDPITQTQALILHQIYQAERHDQDFAMMIERSDLKQAIRELKKRVRISQQITTGLESIPLPARPTMMNEAETLTPPRAHYDWMICKLVFGLIYSSLFSQSLEITFCSSLQAADQQHLLCVLLIVLLILCFSWGLFLDGFQSKSKPRLTMRITSDVSHL